LKQDIAKGLATFEILKININVGNKGKETELNWRRPFKDEKFRFRL
jgi:hypothetical protein